MVSQKEKNIFEIITLTILTLFILFALPHVFADPTGGDIGTSINTSTAPNDTAESHNAYAGNVSGITITAYSTTQTWQGYYGNVSGTVQLADAQDNVMYNWSLASPEGEVYATTNQSLEWPSIQCFNMSANGTMASTGSEVDGATNIAGLNLTLLEDRFTIAYDDVDGVDETFVYTGGAGHDLFYTGSNEFTAGECNSTRIYRMNGSAENNIYEEAILYEPESGSIVFASIIEESTVYGFKGTDNDFEMLVLEDGHGTNTVHTVYYFFVEIE
jgi:hypothetical protein